MALVLLLLTQDRPPGIVIRPSIVYPLILLFCLSAALIVYSYFVVNASILFYLAVTLVIVGTGGVRLGIKRTPLNSSRIMSIHTGYSMNKIRLWGFLIGLSFSFVFALVLLGAWGIKLFNWSILITLIILGLGLGIGSCFGLWLELKKSKH
jgi:hypothetical protein